VLNAWPDNADPTSIWLKLSLPLQPGERLAYGAGLRPHCDVVDAADMPLCANSATLRDDGTLELDACGRG
jgi:hypothetical protein